MASRMKGVLLILTVLTGSLVSFGAGPLYRHEDPAIQQEFQNTYLDIKGRHAFLTTGTSGYHLTGQGSGVKPIWEDKTVLPYLTLTTDLAGGTPDTFNTLYRDSIIKGWIGFNGTGTIAIGDSYNVTSITDHGTGDYTVTWDRDFGNTSYAVVCAAYYSGQCTINNTGGVLGGSVRIFVEDNAGSAVDRAYVSVIAVGRGS